jgi:NADPH:quinone reductase-like Zn-dependent oxidoreductase
MPRAVRFDDYGDVELAALVEKGALEVPVARVYPLAEVREADRDLARRRTRGTIVPRP